MSENPVPREIGARTLDFTGVNIIGLHGLISINGDISPAQTLVGTIDGAISWADTFPGQHAVIARIFNGGADTGLVPSAVGHPATDYLAADATWKTIPGGGGGIVSINADATPAQLLTVVGPAAWSIPVAGTHRITLNAFAGATHPGYVPDPGVAGVSDFLAANGTWKAGAGFPGGQNVISSINGDGAAAQLLTVVGPAAWDNPVYGTERLTLTQFAGSGVPGYVPDPVAHGATDYLAADATWKPIPGAGFGVTSINGDTTAAQIMQITGAGAQALTITDPGGGFHNFAPQIFSGTAGNPVGVVPDPGVSPVGYYLTAGGTWGSYFGITSINGDYTQTQLLTVVGPAAWSIPVAGTQRITLDAFAGVGAPGYVPDPTIATHLVSYLGPDGAWHDIPFTSLSDISFSGKVFITNLGGGGLHEINVPNFPSAGISNEGLVPDSTGHLATETLHADGSWS